MAMLSAFRVGSLLTSVAAAGVLLSCGVRPDRDPPGTLVPTPAAPTETAAVSGAAIASPGPATEAPMAPVSGAPTAEGPAPTQPDAPIVTVSAVPDAEPSVEPVTPPLPAAVGSWAYVNEKVIQPACVRCHSAPRNAAGINLETYAAVKDSLSLVETAAVLEGTMPPRKPLASDLKEILKAWIAAGAPETVAP